MAQIVVTEYQAKIDQYLQQLDKLKAQVKSVVKEREKDSQAEKKNTSELQNAVQQRNRLLQQELNNLKRLQSERAKAFTVKDIEDYNQKIAQTQRNISILKGETSQLGITAGKLKGAFASLGAGIAAAFSAQAIINFSKQTIDAFLEAQKSAELLRYAIISIGGESQVQFERLIKQSQRVQKTTIFGDDQIQQAQAALSAFGLTADQIEVLIPKLADLATVLGTGIAEAANKIGAGLQGSGRELRRFGIDVSASATELDNYNTILQGLEKFSGSAAAAAKTLSGELEQQKNRASDLQEEIGSKLAPAYVRAKVAIFEFISGLLSVEKSYQRSRGLNDDQIDTLIELGFTYDKNTESIIKNGGTTKEANKIFRQSAEAIYSTKLQMDAFVSSIEAGTSSMKDLQQFNKQQIENVKKLNISEAARATIYKLLADTEERLIQTEKARQRDRERTLSSESLRNKSVEELNNLLKENNRQNDIISQSNVKLIEKELEARNKLFEETKKKNEQLRQDLLKQEAAIISAINKARLETATPEERLKIQFEIDNASLEKGKEDLRSIAEIEKSIEANKLEAKRLLNEKYTNDILAEIEKQLLAEQKAADDALKERLRIADDAKKLEIALRRQAIEQGSREALELEKQILTEQLAERIKNIEATVSNEKDAEQQILLAKIEFGEKIKKIDNDIANSGIEAQKKWFDSFVSTFNAASDYAQQIFSAIVQIQNNASQQRIEQLTAEGEATHAALDREIEALNKQREGKYIGEREYNERLKKLQEQKLASEKKIQAEINKEKRKQAETERALKIFEIAINTASAILKITSQTGIFAPPFVAAAIALGALQTAAVLSAPLPKFEKGTKGKKDSGLAIVGERGEEVVNLPKGSQVLHNRGYRKHREAINAMMDNRFEEYVYTKFVMPEIKKIREQSVQAKQQQKEIYLTSTGIDEYGMRRVAKDGIRIANASEIAELISATLNNDIRRRL